MRTTLDLSEDVLLAAKELARRESKTVGEVVSELLRQALTAPSPNAPGAVDGFKPFARRGGIVTNELIDHLRADEAY